MPRGLLAAHPEQVIKHSESTKEAKNSSLHMLFRPQGQVFHSFPGLFTQKVKLKQKRTGHWF